MADDLQALQKQIKALEKTLPAKEAKQLGEILKKTTDIAKKGAEQATKSFSLLGKEIGKIEQEVSDLDDTVEKLSFEKKLKTEDVIKFKKELKELKDEAEALDDIEILSASDLTAKTELLGKLNKKIFNTKLQLEGTGKVSKDVFYDMGAGVESFGDMFSAIGKKSPAALKSAAGAAEDVSQKLGSWGKDLGNAKGLMGAMGGAAKGLGASLGGITKILGGWPGLIIMAVKGMVDFVMDADQFVKDQNKIFAQMRGPDIMTPDVARQFKQFNDQIFSAAANLKVGFNAKAIQEFFNAVSQAGLNITTLSRGVNDYRDAVYIAAKASKTLGMDLPYIGAQMGDLITNFRANLKQVDEAFVQVAFDAGKSGLSTDRFWTAIKNATASMAMYGLFIKSASKVMKTFSESQVMGAEDAAKGTEEMYDVFKKGSLKSKMAVVEFAGGISDAFKERVGELKTGETEIKGKIEYEQSKESPDVAELEKLRNELAANQAQQMRAEKASRGDRVAQANELGQISEKAPEIIARALERQVGPLQNIQGEQYAVLLQAAEKIGLSADLAQKMVYEAQANAKKLDNLADSVTNIKDPEVVRQLEKIKNDSPELKKAIENVTKDSSAKNIEALQALLRSDKTKQAVDKGNYKRDDKTKEELAGNAERTFDEINKQTLSYKDMIDIAKDEVKWRAMSLGIFKGINTGVNDIIGLISKGRETESRKMAKQEVKGMFKKNVGLAKAVGYTGGDLTAGVLEKTSKAIGEKVAGIEKGIESEKAISETLKSAGDIPTALDMLRKEQMSAQMAGDTEKSDRIQAKINSATKKFQEAQKKTNKKGQISNDQRNAILKDISSYNEEDIKKLNTELDVQKQNLTSLKNVDTSTAEVAEYQRLLALSTPEGTQGIVNKLKDSMKQGKTLTEAVEESGIDPSILLTKIQADQKKFGFSSKDVEALASATAPSAGTATSLAHGHATLAEPRKVTSPGILKLDPGETILPKSSNFKTIPATIPAPGPAAPMGPGGGKNISITVNAMEKDLASKIANEVRAVLYKESLVQR
jgi:hypothetical protein